MENGDQDPLEDSPQSPRYRRRWMVTVVFFIGFIDLFGVSMIVPLLPKFIYNLGASRSLAGVIGSAYGALQIFSSPTMGRMSDVQGRKGVLLLSYLLPAFGYFTLSLSGSLWVVALSRIPAGLFKHGLTICKAYLIDITKLEERPAVLGYFNAVSSMGFIFGPIIAGYLSDIDPSLKLTLVTGSAIFSLNFFFVLLFLPALGKDLEIRTEVLPTKVPTGGYPWNPGKYFSLNLSQFWESFRGFHCRQLVDIISIQFLCVFSMFLFRSNFPVFLEENFQISNATFGQVIAFSAVTTTLASATCGIISKYYANHSKHLLHFMILLLVSLFAITTSYNIHFVFFFLLTLSLSTSNLRICMLSLLLVRGKEHEKGAIVGFSNSLSSIGRMLSPIVVGVAQEFGSRFAGLLPVAFTALALMGSFYFAVGDISSNEANVKSKNQH